MTGGTRTKRKKARAHNISDADLQVLTFLRGDGRQKLAELYRSTGIPISTLFDKLGTFKKNNIIDKYTVLLDFEKIGFAIRANLVIRAAPDTSEKLGSYLRTHGNVNNLWKINHGYDYMVEVILRNMNEVEEFTEKIQKDFNVMSVQAFYIVRDMKREGFLSDPVTIEHMFQKEKPEAES
jgi:DNA-binding Lrp family transcriptional regulator